MKTKHTFAVVSTSALAAGMAQGGVINSDPSLRNQVFPCPAGANIPGDQFDLNAEGLYDFYFSFDGLSSANEQKPYIQGLPVEGGTGAANYVLAPTKPGVDSNGKAYQPGLPVTPFGTKIDAQYLTPALYDDGFGNMISRAYFSQDGNGNQVGDWPYNARTEGYVGLMMVDSNSKTNFGWAHVIYDGTLSGKPITLVDWAYEDTAASIVAGATNSVGAPVIYSQSSSQTVPVGATAQMKVQALAEPPPAYQWKAGRIGSGVYTNLSDSTIISGSTTATLKINGASMADMLDYIVVITNSLGAATSTPPMTLTVVVPTVAPTPQVLFPGMTAHFDVSMASGLSPTYHWRKGGANLSDDGRITGATTAHLKVGAVQATDAGNYDVVLTLGSMSTTSAVSSLAVLPQTGKSAYESALLAAGPVAYYRLNETGDPTTNNLLAYDNAGAYNGVYGVDVTNGFAGVAGPRAADGFPGFAPNNAAAAFAASDPVSRIALAPWNLNTNVATFTAWVNPAVFQPAEAGVVCASAAKADTAAGIRYSPFPDQTTGANNIGCTWDDPTGSVPIWGTGITPPNNQWSFVAATFTSSNATVYVFNTNGLSSCFMDGTVSNLISSVGFTNLLMAFDQPEYIGTDGNNPSGGRNFIGAIDEVAVFNKTLTQDQLQTIYNGALGILPPVSLQISRSGSNVQLTWPMGLLLEAPTVSGPWTTNSTAVSPYTVAPSGGSKFYQVLVQ